MTSNNSEQFRNVPQLDAFARTRVSNALRSTFQIDIASSMAVHEVNDTLFEATLRLSGLAQGDNTVLVGRGRASNPKDAELAACMHAEVLLNTRGVEMYSLSSSQKKYAEQQRAKGMWAPMPGEGASPNPVDAAPIQCLSTVKSMKTTTVVAPTRSSSSAPTAKTPAIKKPAPVMKVTYVNAPRPAGSNASDAEIEADFDPVYRVDPNDYPHAWSCGMFHHNILDLHARSRLYKFFLDNGGGVIDKHVQRARSKNHTITAVRLPLPKQCGEWVARGCVRTPQHSVKLAEFLMAMHAELIIDALGVPYYRSEIKQALHADSARRGGRWATAETSRDHPELKTNITIPRPLRLSDDIVVPGHLQPPVLVRELAPVFPLDIEGRQTIFDVALPRVGIRSPVMSYLLASGLSGNARRNWMQIVLTGDASATNYCAILKINVPVSETETFDTASRTVHAIGISTSQNDAVLLCEQHACEIFDFFGMSTSNNWKAVKNKELPGAEVEGEVGFALRHVKAADGKQLITNLRPNNTVVSVSELMVSKSTKERREARKETARRIRKEREMERLQEEQDRRISAAAGTTAASPMNPFGLSLPSDALQQARALPSISSDPVLAAESRQLGSVVFGMDAKKPSHHKTPTTRDSKGSGGVSMLMSPDGFCICEGEGQTSVHSLENPHIHDRASITRVKEYFRRNNMPLNFGHSFVMLGSKMPATNDHIESICLYRAEILFTMPGASSSTQQQVRATGEGPNRQIAEQCCCMHAEMVIDALGGTLHEHDALQRAHLEFIATRPGRAFNSGNFPPPIRKVGKKRALTRVIGSTPAVDWHILNPPIINMYEKNYAMTGGLVEPTPDEVEFEKFLHSVSRGIRHYFYRVRSNLIGTANHQTQREYPLNWLATGHSLQNGLAFYEGVLPLPGKTSYVPIGTYVMRHAFAGIGLNLHAARTLEACGIRLHDNDAKQAEYEANARKFLSPLWPGFGVCSHVPNMSATVPQLAVVASVAHPFTDQLHQQLERHVRRKEGNAGGTQHDVTFDIKQPKTKVRDTTEQVASEYEFADEEEDDAASTARPSSSSSSAPLPFYVQPTSPADPFAAVMETSNEKVDAFVSWASAVRDAERVLSLTQTRYRSMCTAMGRIALVGDPIIDDALQDAQREKLDVHARTLVYNFCVRKGTPYPEFSYHLAGSGHICHFVVPGYPDLIARGYGPRRIEASRRAAMHCIEVLRRIDPEFQYHSSAYNYMRQLAIMGSGELNVTSEVMRRLMQFHSLCQDTPEVKVRSSCVRASEEEVGKLNNSIHIHRCVMSIDDGSGETIAVTGKHGTRLGAEREATELLFREMYTNLPSFQALLDVLKAHPQLHPEHVLKLEVPASVDGTLDVMLKSEIATTMLGSTPVASLLQAAKSPKSGVHRSALAVSLKAPPSRRNTVLPIASVRETLLSELQESRIVVLCGTTGCGKTTQVPQYLLEAAPAARIVVTQPRRLSAISIARRVAHEMGTSVGGAVGYSVRFDSQEGSHINFCTTGIVLRMLLTDPELENVTHIIVDEVHERDVNTDFLLVLLRQLVRRRKDLSVIVMSATLNAEQFAHYFGHVPVVSIEGGMYPVDVHYLDQIAEVAEKEGFRSTSLTSFSQGKELVATSPIDYPLLAFLVKHILTNAEEHAVMGGCVLVFLPGLQEIMTAQDSLAPLRHTVDIGILHSNVTNQDQMRVFDAVPENRVKVILSTNIAESAVTIPDVRVVIDAGRTKEMVHAMHFGATNVGKKERTTTAQLTLQLASKANCVQRKGRAGRTRGGRCYRLFSREHYEAFDDFRTPEIQRIPLEDLTLQVLAAGQQPHVFFSECMDPPSTEAVELGISRLMDIAAIEKVSTTTTKTTTEPSPPPPTFNITSLGRALGCIPTSPKIARMLVLATALGCLDTVLTFAASREVGSLFHSAKTSRFDSTVIADLFAGKSKSDHLAPVIAYNEWSQLVALGDAKRQHSFISENSLSEHNLSLISRYKAQFHSILRSGLGMLDDDNFGEQRGAVFLDTSEHSRHATHTALVKAVLCSALTPHFALHVPRTMRSGAAGGMMMSSVMFRSKLHPHIALSELSVLRSTYDSGSTISAGPRVPAHLQQSPFIAYSDTQYNARLRMPIIRDATVVSVWAILLLGVDASKVQYRADLNLCVVDDWLMMNMESETFETIHRLKVLLNKCIDRKVEAPWDGANNALLADVANTVGSIVASPVSPPSSAFTSGDDYFHGVGSNNNVTTRWVEEGVIPNPALVPESERRE